MHGLVDSSDPGMELAETEEVALSEKQVCAWFWSDSVGRLFYEWGALISTLASWLHVRGVRRFEPTPSVVSPHQHRLKSSEKSF